MAIDVQPYLDLLPELRQSPQHLVRMVYDPEGDTLTIHFRDPNLADDSEMTDEGVIVRYDAAGAVIGLTILRASQRRP